MEKEKSNLYDYDFLKIIYDIIEQIYKNKESHKKNMKKKEYGFFVKKMFLMNLKNIYVIKIQKNVSKIKMFLGTSDNQLML